MPIKLKVRGSKAKVPRRRSVFVWCLGQDDNIGDVVLRRALLHNIAGMGPLHVYVGRVESDFVTALQLREIDQTHQNFWSWFAAALHARFRNGILVCDKPGELTLDIQRLLRQLANVCLNSWGTSRRSFSVSLGVGIRTSHSRMLPLFRSVMRSHRLLAWRDAKSREVFGSGEIIPDLALIDRRFDPIETRETNDTMRRNVVVALRGDGPVPPDAWFQAVRDFAAEIHADLHVVVQVRRDRARAAQLCDKLSARLLDWTAQSHLEQEQRLRSIYASALLAISDRLHVLILAMMEGAIPICLAHYDEQKIQRHFDAIGPAPVRFDCRARDSAWIQKVLRTALQRTDDFAAARCQSRRALQSIFDRVDTWAAD